MVEKQGRVCPECGTRCEPDECHVCPAACCCIVVPQQPREAECPYCGVCFETDQGHVCVWLLRLQEPAQ
jgi:hypothetical protein